MPVYEFSCPTCGQTFERDLPLLSNRSETRCPSGHRNVRRVYSAPSVVFKGSGFYSTDHRSVSVGEEGKS
jgi:putative FmdB family regulatory protein